MARKKRRKSIKTTRSKTKERDEGEKNKDGVKKLFFLCSCAQWGSLFTHVLLWFYILLLDDSKPVEYRLHRGCKACNMSPSSSVLRQLRRNHHCRYFEVEFLYSFGSNTHDFIREAQRLWRILQTGTAAGASANWAHLSLIREVILLAGSFSLNPVLVSVKATHL